MTWGIAAYGWLWFWGFLTTASVVRNAKNDRPLSKLDWLVCALWPVAVPLAVVGVMWGARRA